LAESGELMALRLTLTTKIFGLVIAGLLVMSGLLIVRSEAVIEDAILEQVKQQARIFLLGVERELQLRGDPGDARNLEQVLDHVMMRQDWSLAFAVRQIYAYDRDGRVLARRGGPAVGSRDMAGHYGDVIRRGVSYLGEDVEYKEDAAAGRRVPVVDVIVPLSRGDEIVAGLEVEIDLNKTRAIIQRHDDRFEDDMLLWLTVFGVVLLAFFWLVTRQGLILPVQRLAGLTKQIAEGDLSTRLRGLGRDEIGQLGNSINVMADSIERLFEEQEQAYLQSMQSLAKALQAKDAYTAQHSGRVAKFSVMLGRRLGLPEEQLTLLKQGALMHDLGKISIPDAILNKPEPLSEEEFEVMRGHPVATAAIMRPLKRFKAFAEIAAWHHERWDGNGYPDGLQGEQIPLLARIVGLADTWDAMTGDRVYRKGMTSHQAIDIIAAERDSGQWDPELVDVFVGMIQSMLDAQDDVAHDVTRA
jgi:HAMP domain-containing protein